MKLKKAFMTIIAICLVLTTSACDSSLEITGIEVASYPDKLFYVIGIDNELNLDGGTVHILTKGYPKPIDDNIKSMKDSQVCNVIYDIDFNTAGIYTVNVERYKYSFSFAVQVVSFEELEKIVNSKR